MESYTNFAYVYDTFMDNVPYDAWCEYLHMLLKKYGVEEGILLDLGCGTGNMTQRLGKLGYDMIGVDLSEDMLAIAREKSWDAKTDILYLLQDMRSFELYGTVRAVVSICDSMNYILKDEDMIQVLRLVNNYLDPEGVFIFDLNTVYKYETMLGDRTIAENRESCSFIWDNFYDKDKQINEYELSIFVKADEISGEYEAISDDEELRSKADTEEQTVLDDAAEDWDDVSEEDNYAEDCGDVSEDENFDEDCGDASEGELFYRFTEVHYQRAYTLEHIKALIEASGMKFAAAYDAMTLDAPKPESERIYVIAREQGKKRA